MSINLADHFGLLNLIVGSFKKSLLSRSDLFQEGAIGLLKAAARFDPARGTKFAAFAVPWIRGAILDAIRKEAKHRLVHLGEEVWAWLPAPDDASVAAIDGRDAVASLLALLDHRRRQALMLWSGVADGSPKTCRQIGEALGVTKQRAHRLLRQGLRQLGRTQPA